MTYKGTPKCLTDLSAEILQARGNGRIYLKHWKGKIYNQDYCTFKIDEEIKNFSEKQKLREFSTTKPAIQGTSIVPLKGLI